MMYHYPYRDNPDNEEQEEEDDDENIGLELNPTTTNAAAAAATPTATHEEEELQKKDLGIPSIVDIELSSSSSKFYTDNNNNKSNYNHDHDDNYYLKNHQQQQYHPLKNNNNNNNNMPYIVRWIQKYASILLMPILPMAWCILFVCTMDREKLLSAYAMPLLGIVSACLANTVPVGGGIIFVPILTLILGDVDHFQLGPAFSVATMTFGNGIFGFLSWLQKDPNCIIWQIVPFAVIPAWIGSFWAMMYPFLSPTACRHLFAIFCFKVAIVVGRGIYLGNENENNENTTTQQHQQYQQHQHKLYSYGNPNVTYINTKNNNYNNNNNFDDSVTFSILEDTMGNGNNHNDDDDRLHDIDYNNDPTTTTNNINNNNNNNHNLSYPETHILIWSIGASFLAGSILVAHIGIGNAMTTFLVSKFLWNVPSTKSAIVTGILCGGWTSIVPFVYHLLVKQDVPIALWVMGLPGVYIGARIAPTVHEYLGIWNVLRSFCIFLIVISIIMISI